jgi:hypothetical protein
VIPAGQIIVSAQLHGSSDGWPSAAGHLADIGHVADIGTPKRRLAARWREQVLHVEQGVQSDGEAG